MLIERADGLHRVVVETQHARDVGAALASRDDHLARTRRAARQHGEHLPGAPQPELTRRDIPGDEAKRLERIRPVRRLEIGFDVVIVCAEEHRKRAALLEHPRSFISSA
jgi:hypothetical protein